MAGLKALSTLLVILSAVATSAAQTAFTPSEQGIPPADGPGVDLVSIYNDLYRDVPSWVRRYPFQWFSIDNLKSVEQCLTKGCYFTDYPRFLHKYDRCIVALPGHVYVCGVHALLQFLDPLNENPNSPLPSPQFAASLL